MEATEHDVQSNERSVQLEQAIDRISKWQEDGTLDNLEKILHFVNAALDSMTPEIVDGLVGTVVQVMEVGDQLLQSRLFKMAPDILSTSDAILANPPKTQHGLWQLMKTVRDPEVQDGMQLMLGVLREVGRGINGKQK